MSTAVRRGKRPAFDHVAESVPSICDFLTKQENERPTLAKPTRKDGARALPRVAESKTSVRILRSRRPVGPMTDCNHELGYWLWGATKLWIQHNRGARQIRTPNLGIC